MLSTLPHTVTLLSRKKSEMSSETLHLDKTVKQIAIWVIVNDTMHKTSQLRSDIQFQGDTFWVVYNTLTDNIC